MMILAVLLQAAPVAPTVTLSEARTMSPTALAERLLAGKVHGPVVDAIVNGRGLVPPTASVMRVWLVERMVPFNATLCRSHVHEIEMGGSDPKVEPWAQPVPTHPVRIEQHDRLWVPPGGQATMTTCAVAPATASGFQARGLGLEASATVVDQARRAFAPDRSRAITVTCRGDRGVCGPDPRATLAAIDWRSLGLVEEVSADEEAYYSGDTRPGTKAWGPARVKFTFPWAAHGQTWEITVTRTPRIVAVQMNAEIIIYH